MDLGLSLLLIFVLGFAIQRGSICAVIAIEEILVHRRATRFLGFVTCALWVVAVVWVAQTAGGTPMMPDGYRVSGLVVLGAVIYGGGAVINMSCAMGTLARLGSGDVAYAAMFPGFVAGAAAAARVPGSHPVAMTGPVSGVPEVLWVGLASTSIAVVIWQIVRTARTDGARVLAAPVWPPLVAMAVIGLCAGLMIALAAPWSHTLLLDQVGGGMVSFPLQQSALLAAMLAGAIVSARTAGRLAWKRPTLRQVLRSLVGGAAMGFGSGLVPGGNDAFVLYGLPFLWPYAAVAYVSMNVAIIMMLFPMMRWNARRPS